VLPISTLHPLPGSPSEVIGLSIFANPPPNGPTSYPPFNTKSPVSHKADTSTAVNGGVGAAQFWTK